MIISKKFLYNTEKIYCTIVYHPKENMYKFLISGNSYDWKAFKTVAGFKQFMEVYGLQIDPTKNKIVKDFQGNCLSLTTKFKFSKFSEFDFSKISDIPNLKKCKKFLGLENGSYVDCYYKKLKNGNIVYIPNPNAKEVYHPLSLDEHLAHSKKLG